LKLKLVLVVSNPYGKFIGWREESSTGSNQTGSNQKEGDTMDLAQDTRASDWDVPISRDGGGQNILQKKSTCKFRAG
jgi:hypothetical protein